MPDASYIDTINVNSDSYAVMPSNVNYKVDAMHGSINDNNEVCVPEEDLPVTPEYYASAYLSGVAWKLITDSDGNDQYELVLLISGKPENFTYSQVQQEVQTQQEPEGS